MVFVYHALNAPLLWSGVDLFFVLSGYLITGILLRLKEKAKNRDTAASSFFGPFYFRRALRILPPYVGFLFVVSAFFHVGWRHIWFWYALFAANFANAFHKVAIGAMIPLWSLAVEEQFYFFWPLIVFLAGPRILKRLCLAIMIGAPILRAIWTPLLSSNAPIYTLTPFRADLLACGAFIALSEYESPAWIRLHRRAAGACAIAAGIVLAALSTLHNFRHNDNTIFFNTVGYSLFVVIFGGTLIWVLATEEGLIHSVLVERHLRYLGQVSYTFYLYHVAILILVGRHLHSAALTGLVSFAIVTVISGVSWAGLESPILNFQQYVPGFRTGKLSPSSPS